MKTPWFLAILLAAACATSSAQSTTPPAAQETKQDAPPPAPDTLKDPGQQLAFFVADMVRAIRAHNDCDSSASAAAASLEKNRAQMKDAVRRLKKKAEELSGEASEKYWADTMKLMEELSPGAEASLKEFEERCPEQDKHLGESLGSLEHE